MAGVISDVCSVTGAVAMAGASAAGIGSPGTAVILGALGVGADILGGVASAAQ